MEGEAHASERPPSPNQINAFGNADLLLHCFWVATMDDQVDVQVHEHFPLVRNGHHTKW
jgi:hypothetical protein